MFPQYLPNRAAYAYARASMWAAARRSDRILTVSEASKRDILSLFNVKPEKIVVVYNAIDEHFSTTPSEEHVARIRERYQLDHKFVLYVGNIKPHKNLVRLIEAFSQLRRTHDDLKLLIIGDEISRLPALRRAVHRNKLHKFVRFLGYLKDDTLTVLYRLASVFVFPSLYEGFGLPPLEAMASGTPVVTSNVSSLPEVTGDAAVLVDPYDVDSIGDGMRRILDDPRLAEELRIKGLKRARDAARREIGRQPVVGQHPAHGVGNRFGAGGIDQQRRVPGDLGQR
jgi:glycosyltransferase involved in cell wall biosynthesis